MSLEGGDSEPLVRISNEYASFVWQISFVSSQIFLHGSRQHSDRRFSIYRAWIGGQRVSVHCIAVNIRCLMILSVDVL
jgi:hypothetical protein